MKEEILYWIINENDPINLCSVCSTMPIQVPFGGHKLSRIWNRLKPGEILLHCPNNCLEGQEKIKVKILRPE